MTPERAAVVLKLALAAAALLAGSGVGYYFGLFLPHQARMTAAASGADQRVQDAAGAAAERARAIRAEDAQSRYRQCLAAADLVYQGRWNTSCRTQHDADAAAFEDCMDDWFTTRSGCERRHPIRAPQHCALPAPLAAGFVADRNRAKDVCLQEMQAALAP